MRTAIAGITIILALASPCFGQPPSNEGLVASAKGMVRKQLRDPKSASFADIEVRTAGPQLGVCGTVNSKNALGGMTGPQLFVYDGKGASIILANAGAENGTNYDASMLGALLHGGLVSYDKFCKAPRRP